MRSGRAAAPLVAAVLLLAAGCGSSTPGSSSTSGPPLLVSAAASLQKAFTAYGGQFRDARAKFSFAGSDELAAQIEQGVRPDVYAAANTKLPEQLYRKGLVSKPVVFAGNRLVLAVPAGSTKVGSLASVEKGGISLAIGSASVPVGSYTHKVLDELPAARRKAILANVRSEEPDVSGIVGKLAQGAVDAGFVYVSDVRGSGGELRAIELPASLRPSVAYGAAVVKGAKHPEQARAFVEGLVSGAGRQALRAAGFEPPPPG